MDKRSSRRASNTLNSLQRANGQGIGEKVDTREVFDQISLNLIQHLENFDGVSSVRFVSTAPLSEEEIEDWESKNKPCLVPECLKAFLMISNGFDLKWSMKFDGRVIPLGRLHLSRLSEFSLVENMDDFPAKSEEGEEDGTPSATDSSSSPIHRRPANRRRRRSSRAASTHHHTAARRRTRRKSKRASVVLKGALRGVSGAGSPSSGAEGEALSFPPKAFDIDSSQSSARIALVYDNGMITASGIHCACSLIHASGIH
eukprot:280227_1